MSLRLRLTLLYTMVLGGALLIFGALVYGLVSVILIDQADETLSKAAEQIVSELQVNISNKFDPRSLTNYQPTENIIFQLWGNNQELQFARPVSLKNPLDENALWAGSNIFTTVQYLDQHLRVLSIPLQTPRGPIGILQIAYNLKLIDFVQESLAIILVLLAVLSMITSWLAAWFATGRALHPLSSAIRIATLITKADDLQRRIPISGSSDDEVGQLISTFNQTLSRLEKLFTTQRRFLADVSHELRTPLTLIKLNVDVMRKAGSLDKEMLAEIDSEVDRLNRLVEDQLLLAQFETGKISLNLKPVELDTILLEVYNDMNRVAGNKIEIKILEIDQVLINGDKDKLKQVFLNIIGNALQYTQEGGLITLKIRKVGHQAQVLVTDNGPGIPPQDLPHIFERFYRVEKSRKRDSHSSFGLGLSIAYWIVRSHDGTIEVTSKVNAGTTFSVWLPLLESLENKHTSKDKTSTDN